MADSRAGLCPAGGVPASSASMGAGPAFIGKSGPFLQAEGVQRPASLPLHDLL